MATKKESENYELLLYRLDEIDKKLDRISRHYVTKEEFDDFKDEVRVQLKRKSFYNVINPIIASVTTAVITFLIIEFLRRT